MHHYFSPVILLYCLWNCGTFFLVLLDKRRARRNTWRIRERTFFLAALALGAAGVWLGMYVCRHKTRHRTFVFGIPLLLSLNLGCCYFFWQQGWLLFVK